MRSVYLISGCCLSFAAVMVLGLCLHSCKSKKQLESSIQMDSTGHYKHHEIDDSIFFEQFIQRNRKKIELSIITYQFVKDSAGNVIGSVPDKQIGLTVDNDSTTHKQTSNVVHNEKGDSTDVEVKQNQTVKEKPPPDNNHIFLFLVLASLLYILKRSDFCNTEILPSAREG